MESTIDVDVQQTVEQALKAKNYDLVHFVESFEKLLEVNLKNVNYLITVAKKLQKKKESHMASQLLLAIYERFKDNLKEANLSAKTLKILKLAHKYNPQRKDLKEDIIAAYRDTYSKRENLDLYLEKSEIEEDGDLTKAMDWLDVYLSYDEGSYILHEDFGVGKVVSIDVDEGRFTLDFYGKTDPKTNEELHPPKKGHAVSERMIPQFADPLANDSFVLLSHLEVDKLKQLAKDAPIDLVKLVLNDYENRVTLKQLKAKLIPTVIQNNKWASWWKDVKAKLALDPYYTVGEGPSAVIEQLEIARSHDEDYIARFRAGETVSEMLDEARSIILNTSNAGPQFKHEVLRLCENQQKMDIPLPAQVELFLFLKENGEFLGVDVEGDPTEYLKDPEQILEIIEGIYVEDYQQTLLQLYKTLYPDDYLQFFADAIFVTHRKNWDFLWKEIRKHPDIANAMISRLDASNEDYPIQYHWLSKNVFERKWEKFQVPTDIRIFENLLRILGKLAILSNNTGDKRELANVRKTITSVKSLLTYKDCFYIQRYIKQAGSDEVIYFDQLLHTKIAVSESLRATLSKPVVKRLAEDASYSFEERRAKKVAPEDLTVYVTNASLTRKKEEYDHLTKVVIPQTLEDVKTAREHGDLSENAEYDAAQEKLARCNEKEQRLRNEMTNARLIDFNEITGATVTIGTEVTLENNNSKSKKSVSFTILGIWDGDEDNNIISYKSPLAQKFIGKTIGDVIEFTLDSEKDPEPHTIKKIKLTKSRGKKK